MAPRFRRLHRSILFALPLYGFMSLLAWRLQSNGAPLPAWMEGIYAALFMAPVFVLCKPWYPLLSRWGLMQGEWIRFPSSLGVVLVFGVYTAVLVVLGRWLDHRS